MRQLSTIVNSLKREKSYGDAKLANFNEFQEILNAV